MKKKNILPIILIAGAAGYYFYTQNKKNKIPKIPEPLDPTEIDRFERDQAIKAEEQKPKTLFAKAAALVKKAANTPEGKSLLKKGLKAISKNKELKKLGATYL